MNQQQQIHYWAHMLDEAFPQKKLVEAHIQPSSTSSNPLPPMTKQELQQIERKYGTTDNFQESGWILPDGKLLQMGRNTERWTQHDFILPPDSYYARVGISEDDDISQILLQAGFIRINFSNNPCTVDMRVKPTAAQMDRLYDLIDLDYSSMKDYYYKLKSCLDEFQLELPGKLIRYEDEDEFKKRFLNDIRNAFSYNLNESKDQLLTEGKHWPEDYIKTGINLVKASPLGNQAWYSDNFIQQDMKTFASEFGPLSHKNSNLGFFSTIIRWFIEYSGTSKEKYQEFIERKLDGIIGTLQTIVNDPSYDKTIDEIKTKWTFAQFEELQKKITDEAKASSDEKLKNIQKRDDYDLIPIYSYEELHEKFGGDWTGWHGQSEWCHTNGKSTYESWTKDGTQMFFVLAKKDWQKVFQPEQKPTGKDYNAYDEYGLSLIAILVDAATGNLLNETLRWNHVIEPSYVNPGASADKAFKNNWGALSQVVGIDVKAACEKECKALKQKLQKEADAANRQVAEILNGKIEIDDDTIPKMLKSKLTKVDIPNSVTSIWDSAFYGCRGLTSIMIPNSVTSIGDDAFSGCTSLMSVTIPDSVTSIWDYAFDHCTSLMSVTIPNSVTNIGEYAFYKCSELTSVTIPNNVTNIEEGTFSGCNKLASVTIPDSVTSIGSYAFYECNGLTNVTIPNSVMSIQEMPFYGCSNLKSLVFKGKTPDEVKAMENYPWGIKDESIIKCEGSLSESKATYLQKYKDEADAKKIVDAFWQIKSRLSAPQNDIDWWIKKPFADLKSFVLSYSPANKKQRRDADYRKQALENDAKLLDTRDGYEIWYVPTYEAMRILGRFYKGRSAKWCVASDDPEFWFDNHDEDEFVVLVREQPKNDEFDKVALQMTSHGRYFNQKQIIPWDLENNDETFTARYYMTGLDLADVEDLIYYAWQLFKDNGEQREQYYDVD